eukprot:NODE_2083_length_2297_cov_2.764055.p4 GENE.NODE_2083_length_2297_cov_2.764055~~NODE_2083_length_2297_cov_2.764055.p4  ORF type:complete len:180 (-),score=46.66 NODE_2083_length_2297_cov_2.764055:579-1118(-)
MQEIRCLGRMQRCVAASADGPDQIQYETDQRHAELIIAAMCLEPSREPLVTPGDKADDSPLEGDPLGQEELGVFRSCCMRMMYLALDRLDFANAAKECGRAMSSPTDAVFRNLKSIARYVLGAPHLIWRFPRQRVPKFADGFVDANFGGCMATRKSTTCFVARLGRHVVKVTSTTQKVT